MLCSRCYQSGYRAINKERVPKLPKYEQEPDDKVCPRPGTSIANCSRNPAAMLINKPLRLEPLEPVPPPLQQAAMLKVATTAVTDRLDPVDRTQSLNEVKKRKILNEDFASASVCSTASFENTANETRTLNASGTRSASTSEGQSSPLDSMLCASGADSLGGTGTPPVSLVAKERTARNKAAALAKHAARAKKPKWHIKSVTEAHFDTGGTNERGQPNGELRRSASSSSSFFATDAPDITCFANNFFSSTAFSINGCIEHSSTCSSPTFFAKDAPVIASSANSIFSDSASCISPPCKRAKHSLLTKATPTTEVPHLTSTRPVERQTSLAPVANSSVATCGSNAPT